jgi:hypothetical protein
LVTLAGRRRLPASLLGKSVSAPHRHTNALHLSAVHKALQLLPDSNVVHLIFYDDLLESIRVNSVGITF